MFVKIYKPIYFELYSVFPEAMVTCGKELGLFGEKNRLYFWHDQGEFIISFLYVALVGKIILTRESKIVFFISYFRKFFIKNYMAKVPQKGLLH